MTQDKTVTCPLCKGTGWDPGMEECPDCLGAGMVYEETLAHVPLQGAVKDLLKRIESLEATVTKLQKKQRGLEDNVRCGVRIR